MSDLGELSAHQVAAVEAMAHFLMNQLGTDVIEGHAVSDIVEAFYVRHGVAGVEFTDQGRVFTNTTGEEVPCPLCGEPVAADETCGCDVDEEDDPSGDPPDNDDFPLYLEYPDENRIEYNGGDEDW